MSYYISGYKPPKDVSSADDVIRYQKLLGITPDGIWGKKTQAAYEKYNVNNTTNHSPEASDTSFFGNGDFDWENISKKLKEYLSEMLRPAVDDAIENRRKSAQTVGDNAEINAASRGMTESGYADTVRQRENKDAESDIADIESSYIAELSNKLYSAMTDLWDTYSENKRYEEDMAFEREKLENDREQFEKNLQYKNSSKSSSGGGSTARSSENEAASDENPFGSSFDFNDYCLFLHQLGDQALSFFESDSLYWQYIRRDAINDLSIEGYERLRKLYEDGKLDSYRQRKDGRSNEDEK